MEFFLNGSEFREFRESDTSLKHELGWIYPLCYLCLNGPVVAFLSLIQEVEGSNNLFKMIIIFITEVKYVPEMGGNPSQ